MRIDIFNIKTGQKRIYGNKYIGIVTKYLDCEVTNIVTKKTIKGICLTSPIKNNLDFLKNTYKWEI